ncbi:MAG: hypothetical protein A2648_01010 [Candidatus Lloydbacteria bacterium RIFCSPHIGHO2_01_FULL_41_20]|uniref:Capsular polysaccharide assembling protein CapF C-terminal domain-containing protein n=1 Tax=Candidatus Lloydbacteria bacterium RIFCSPHIGHO2_01_FULL_41_20 TaxID=1798657 RepID=A0A1G2CVH3_9BACT|nr:MAG: hypothetical protein A2648_01010 [Candidatus Lloydbacteria bacterium RIFCSPHIGHO2_01_FULL_41_20]
MPKWWIGLVSVGHSDQRRTIFDVVKGGVEGKMINQISAFDCLFAGNYIGRHYHKKMWEVYYIFSGEGTMHMRDIASGEEMSAPMGPRFRAIVPPNVVHELVATTDMTLIIAATGEQGPHDTFFPVRD